MDKKQLKAASKIIKRFKGDLSHRMWMAKLNLKLGELKLSSGTVQNLTSDEPKITPRTMLPLLLAYDLEELGDMAGDVLDIIAPKFMAAL